MPEERKKMLTYTFTNKYIPLYEQVYNAIKSDILSGQLRPGTKLPSKRSFASHNGMSTITIQNAYDQLISEGYIYTLPRKGYFVSKLEGLRNMPQKLSLNLDIKTPQPPKTYTYDLSNNMINPDNFPFSIWAKLSRDNLAHKRKELMSVAPANGLFELREAISKHLSSFRGMRVDPNQIIVGAGTEYLYGILIQLLGNDYRYCIENPGYKKLLQIYQQYGVECVYANIDGNGIMPGELHDKHVDIAHICPNHHFPTGITMPASRRYEILSWANEESGHYIIEDDYDSELRSHGKPLPTLFSIDGCEKVIYMNTFSKSLAPTMRISYMVLPVHLANRFYEHLAFSSCTVSNIEQYTLASFINEGYFEKHINRMRLYYARKRKQLLAMLKTSPLNTICEVHENESGLHFLLKLHTHLSEEEVQTRLAKEDMRMQSLSDYYMDNQKNQKHMYIIHYSNLVLDDMSYVFQRIYELVHD